MMLPTTPPRADRLTRAHARGRAFTLLELILVMALLVIGFGAALPTLRRFFGGRTLDAEANRLQALTRYAQNRAIHEGVPMVVWIDQETRRYGLQVAAGFLAERDDDVRAREFVADETVRFVITEPRRLTTFGSLSGMGAVSSSDALLTARRSTVDERNLTQLPAIRLLPDGYLDPRSPELIELRRGEDEALWLVQTTNRLAYEIRSERPVLATY